MKKNKFKITESQLRKIVAESVKNVLKEGQFDDDMNNVQELRDRMYELAQTNPKALAEAVNMFINELGDVDNWFHFGRCLDLMDRGY